MLLFEVKMSFDHYDLYKNILVDTHTLRFCVPNSDIFHQEVKFNKIIHFFCTFILFSFVPLWFINSFHLFKRHRRIPHMLSFWYLVVTKVRKLYNQIRKLFNGVPYICCVELFVSRNRYLKQKLRVYRQHFQYYMQNKIYDILFTQKYISKKSN